jgi:hypothetical protein
MHHTILAFSRCVRMRLNSLHGTSYLITIYRQQLNERTAPAGISMHSSSSRLAVLLMFAALRNFYLRSAHLLLLPTSLGCFCFRISISTYLRLLLLQYIPFALHICLLLPQFSSLNNQCSSALCCRSWPFTSHLLHIICKRPSSHHHLPIVLRITP